MSILMLTAPQNEDQTREIKAWLEEHGISAGDSFAPMFIDTDAERIYWLATVWPIGAESRIWTEGGAPQHDSLIANCLPKYGLETVDSIGVGGRLGLEVVTPLKSVPPAWAVRT